MQVIHKDEDERGATRETGLMGAVLCARRVSRHVKRKCVGRIGGRETRI